MLSLFCAGHDWIAWTPEGYYAASPYGERLMGWQINRGPKEMAEFYPAGQFRASLYQPELIRQLLATGDVGQALALANQKQGGKIAATTINQVLPPAVTILAPARSGRVEVGQPKLVVKASAKSVGNHPVTSLRLLVNGRPYQGDQGVRHLKNPKLGEVQANWTLDLLPGKHTLVVQAESAVSKGLSPAVEVRHAGKEGPGNLYLVAIGISDYPGDMAAANAPPTLTPIAIDDLFRKKGQRVFGRVETRLLTDKQATGKNIREGLAWLQSRMTARDVGILFFAGHGTRPKRRRFLPAGAPGGRRSDERDPIGTLISGDLLKKALANMPGKLVAILDACHSGATAAVTKKRPQGRSDDLVRDLVSDDYGVVVMCSSQGTEYSMESPQVKHGFFTLALLHGLSGKADFNRDGIIHIHEVNYFAAVFVRQLTGGRQNPVTGGPPNLRSFALTRP